MNLVAIKWAVEPQVTILSCHFFFRGAIVIDGIGTRLIRGGLEASLIWKNEPSK